MMFTAVCSKDRMTLVIKRDYTVKPALVTTCIQRPPLSKDHLVMSQLWLYNAFLPLLRDHLYSKTTIFWLKRLHYVHVGCNKTLRRDVFTAVSSKGQMTFGN